MDSLTQSFLKSGPHGNRRGIALPSGILAIVAVGVLVAGLFAMNDLGAKAVKNREGSSRALQVAEAGVAHALGIMRTHLKGTKATNLIRGANNVWNSNTGDDGILSGFAAIPVGSDIPAAGRSFGGGTYFVKVRDDPADPVADLGTDGNFRVLVECRATMPDGATASLNVLVSHIMLPGVALDGDLEVSGKLNVTGACGGAHVNGEFSGGGQPSAATQWSSTDGSIPSGFVGTKVPGAIPLEIPDLDPMSYCPVGAKTSIPGSVSSMSGTYCINGNVNLSGDVGGLTNWKNVTVIATGSIKIDGKMFFRSAHPDGFVLMAGGDLDIQADAGFEGISYCGGQTYISSKPVFRGQLVCKDKSPHPGSNIVPSNLISGDASVTFDCTSSLNRSYRLIAWYPTQGN